MESGYLNREIDVKFSDIKNQLDRIEEQTMKTNGRVSSLENWQAYVVGFCACVAILILPVAFQFITSFISK